MNFFVQFDTVFTVLETANDPHRPQEESAATPRIRTIGDFQRIWGDKINAAGNAGEKAFRGTSNGIDGETLRKLKKEWERIRPNLAVVLSVLENISVPSSASIEEAAKRIPPSELQPMEKAMNGLMESRKSVAVIRSKPEFAISAFDIVNFRSLETVSQTELSEHLFTLDMAMKELEARYYQGS